MLFVINLVKQQKKRAIEPENQKNVNPIMQFELYQWIVPVIGLFFISRTVLQFLKKKRTASGAFIWTFFWVTIIILAIVPDGIGGKIASILGFKDNVNAVIFVALGLLFIFIFYLSSVIERLETQLTELVRRLAIEEQRKQHNKE